MAPPAQKTEASTSPRSSTGGLSHSLSISRGGIPFMRRRQIIPDNASAAPLIHQPDTDDAQTVLSASTRSGDEQGAQVRPRTSYGSLRSTTPHDRVLQTLIVRLKASLPLYSKRPLSMVETDEPLGQTVASIIQLAKFRFDGVVLSLASLLHDLNAASPPLPARSSMSGPPDPRQVSPEIAQSQLFVTKVLSAAFAFRHHQLQQHQSQSSEPSIRSAKTSLHAWSSPRERQPSSSSSHLSTSAPSTHAPPSARDVPSPDHARPASMTEPPQLSDQVAKYLLHTLLPYLRKSSPAGTSTSASSTVGSAQPSGLAHAQQPGEITLPSSSSVRAPQPPGGTASFSPLPSVWTPVFSPPRAPHAPSPSSTAGPTSPAPSPTSPHHPFFAPTPPGTIATPQALLSVLYTHISNVVYYLSAENWGVVYDKIAEKVREVAAGTTVGEEGASAAEIELISLSALNRTRLLQVLQDLSSHLVQMRRSSQSSIALAVHASLQKWIQTCPSEFLSVIRGDVRLEGAPERIFDTLYSMWEYSPGAIMPTLALLLAVGPERLGGLVRKQWGKVGGGGKKNLLDTLETFLSMPTRQYEVAVLSYVDLCTAAIRVPPEYEFSALRDLAPDFAGELKNRLMSPSPPLQPFWKALDKLDPQLYADAIVAIFWFYPEDTAKQVLPVLLERSQSYAVKLVAVMAMARLAGEARELEFQPDVEGLYAVASEFLPDIYHLLANPPGAEDDEYPVTELRYTPVTKQSADSDGFSDHDLLLLGIIALWRSDFRFLVPQAAAVDRQFEVADRAMLDSQALLRSTGLRSIRIVTTQLMIELGVHVTTLAPLNHPHPALLRSGVHTMQTAISLQADRLMAADSYEDQRLHLNTLLTFLKSFAPSANKAGPNYLVDVALADEIPGALNLVEVALLVTLVTPMTDICVLASSCLAMLVEWELSDGPRSDARRYLSNEELNMRMEAYRQLGDPSIKVIGRQAQQKRVRNTLRRVSFPWPVNVAVWQECHRRFVSAFDQVIVRTLSESDAADTVRPQRQQVRWNSSAEELFEWQSTLNFLAAFAGSCLLPDPSMWPLARFVAATDLPVQFLTMRTPDMLLTSFLSTATEILVRGGAFAQNAVKEALGSELEPKVYRQLLSHLDRLCVANFDKPSLEAPKWEDDSAVVMMQLTTVMKQILPKVEQSPDPLRLNLGRLLRIFHNFVNTFPGQTDVLLRAKLQFASLCELAFSDEGFTVREDQDLKQDLLASLSEWATELQPDRYVSGPSSLVKDVEQTCLRALAALADGLVLKCEEGLSKVQEQSRLFYHYFRFFMGIVNRTLQSPTADLTVPPATYDVKRTMLEKENSVLRDIALTGIANLLFANHQAGFKHCFPMTYHEDPRIRTAFLLMFREALERDVTFQMTEEIAPPSKSSAFIEFIKDPHLLFIQAICEISATNEDIEDLEPVLLHIFDQEESLIALAKSLIDQEFHGIRQESELFRNNSLRNRLLSRIAREQSASYLRRVLSPLIKKLEEIPPEVSLEVDPYRVPAEEERKRNADYLMRITSVFLSALEAASARVPVVIREVCHHIAVVAQKVFPDSVYAAVGGFIFLRCINPAISQPSTVGIDFEMNIRNQRVLLLITKILQSLANNIQFGKEAHMTIFNDFLSSEINVVSKFLKDISSDPRNRPVNWSETPTRYADETDILILHRFLEKHGAAIGQQLLTAHKKASSPQQAELLLKEGKRLWDQLVQKLMEVGDVPEVHAPISTTYEEHAPLQGFMRRHEHTNTDHVAHLFMRLEGENPAFLFNTTRIEADVIEYDALMYLIFKELLDTDPAEKIDVVVNMTSFAESSMIPLRWIKHFIHLIPVELVRRCRSVYFVNVNRVGQAYLRKLYYHFSGVGLERLHYSSLSVAELKAMYPSSSALHAIEKDEGHSVQFIDVDQWDVFQSRQLCMVRVATTSVRVETVKAQPTFPGFQCRLIDIIPLSDVDDIVQMPAVQDEFLFAIIRSRGDAMRFSSKDGEEIMRAIKKAKDSLSGSRPRERSVDYRFNAGTALLNMALLNLCQRDDQVRVSASALLRATVSRMGHNLEALPDSLFLPANPYVTALSFADIIVKALPHIVIDFLKDFCSGFGRLSSTEKIACLKYLRPFIKSLGGDVLSLPTVMGRDFTSMRVRECVRHFITLTVNHDMVHASIQGSVWSVVAQFEALSRLAVDELIKAAVDCQAGSRRCDTLADTLVLLSTQYSRGKIVSRLQKLLTRVTFRSSVPFSENALWNEVAILARLTLIVTSETRSPVSVIVLFPELAHFVTLLAGTGPEKMRISVYGIAVNLLQALANFRVEQQFDASDLHGLIERFRSPEVLLDFGITQTRFGGVERASTVMGTSQISADALRRISVLLLEAAEVGGKSAGQVNSWRARWASLVVATALRSPPYLQTRSFYVIGTLLTSVAPKEPSIDDDLIHQFLHALDVIITKPVTVGKNLCLASILDCLCKLLPCLSLESKHAANLFWLSVFLLQSGITELYDPLMELMMGVLDVLHRRGDLQYGTLSEYLLDARNALAYDWDALEGNVGLRFEEHFSVCLAFVISNALRNPSSVETARSLLYRLVMATRETRNPGHNSVSVVNHESIGYFLALIPVSTSPAATLQLLRSSRVGEAWWPDIATEDDTDPTITSLLRFGILGILDYVDALITLTFILHLLKNARLESEREVFCHMVADAAIDFPKVVEQIFDQLEKTIEPLLTSNNRSILEALGTIFSVVLARPTRSTTSVGRYPDTDEHSRAETTNSLRHALEEYGMEGLIGDAPVDILEYCAFMTRTFT